MGSDRQFIAKVQAATDAAPKRDGRDVAVYLGEPYLRRIIDGAFHLIENKAKSDIAQKLEGSAPAKLPAGFGMTRDGLYFTDPGRDDANPEWVCQGSSVLGECENGMGGDWGVVMSWQDAAEHRHTWIVPCEMFHGEPHAISAHLHSRGLRCSYTKSAQGSLRRCLASVRPDAACRLSRLVAGMGCPTFCRMAPRMAIRTSSSP